MRTQRSVPSEAANWIGHVVFAGTLSRLATRRMNSSLPAPISFGSAIDSERTSFAGSPPVESPEASVRIVTPGSWHGDPFGIKASAAGATYRHVELSPAAFTAVTAEGAPARAPAAR